MLERVGDRLALARAHFRRGAWHSSLVCAPHEVRAAFGRGLEILDAAGIDSPAVRQPPAAAQFERAEALARLRHSDEAERELRQAVMEPVRPGDWPDTLVARIARVQGLVAAARGDQALAVRRLEEAAQVWRGRVGAADAGERWSSALADLGRPVVGVVEPERELARVLEDLEGLAVTTRTEV